VAENGQSPPIIIYKYPSMEVISVLNNGSTRSYTKVDYSPNGELLASQAGEPDYQLTVWDWKKREMILRSKSFSNDVVNVKFSLTVPGQLTTAGIAFVTYICIYNILLHNMTQSNYKVAL
jgi:cilia- and flagella-associated protein 44